MASEEFDVECAEKEIEENPCNIKVLCDLGQHYAYKADYSSALKYYEKIVRINEDNGRAWSALGHCSLLKQDYYKCITAYQRSLLHKEECLDTQLWYGIGCLYFVLEEWKHAETVFLTTLKLKNDLQVKYDIYFKLGVIAGKSMHWEKALEYLEIALEFNTAPGKKIEILLHLAEANYENGRTEKAKVNYEQAIDLDRESIKAYKCYAWALFQKNLYEESKGILNLCVSRGKNSGDVQYLLARCYHAQNDIVKAKSYYEAALGFHPNSFVYWTSAGVLYAETHQYADSFECFTKALGFFSESWEVWNNICILYQLCGQKPEADLASEKASLYFPINTPLQISFTHPAINPNEPIYKILKDQVKYNSGSELLQQLEKLVTKEVYRLIENIKKQAELDKKNEESLPEIVVPKVANPVVKNEKNIQVESRFSPQHVAMFQNFLANPMMLYQMMMMSNAINGSRGQVKEEQESEQVAKTLIDMTGDSIKKKRKSSDDPEPSKKMKEE